MLLFTTSAGAAAALTDRLIGPGVEWWNWVVWPIAAGAGVAASLAILRRQSPAEAAIEVDTSMRLNDRLGSAMALAERAEQDPFANLAVHESEQAAAGIDVARAIRVPWGRSWSWWPAATLIAGAIAYFVPSMHLLDSSARAQQARFNPQANLAAQRALEQAAEAVKPAEAGAAGEEDARRREVLDQLARELEQGSAPPEESLAKAASVLEEAASESSVSAQRSQAVSDELKKSLAALEPPEGQAAGEGESPQQPQGLRESLRQGELGKAAETLDELKRQMEHMPRSQIESMAEEFSRLAEELESQAKEQKTEAEKRGEQSKEALREQGLTDQQAESIAEQPDEEKIKQALREKGFSEESAERLAKELAEEARKREAEEKAAEDARRLSEAAKRASEQLREPQSQEPRSAKPKEPKPATKESSPPREKPPQPPQSPEKQPQEKNPGEQKPEQTPAQEPGGEQGQKENQEPGAPQEQKAEGEQQDGEQEQQDQQGEGEQPDSNMPPMPGVKTPGAPREQQSEGTEKPGDQNTGKKPSDPNQPGVQPGEMPSPDAIDQMKQMLEQMEQQQRDGMNADERARQLREQAKKLLDQATPEQKEQMMKWAQQQMREQGERPETGPDGEPGSREGMPVDGGSGQQAGGGPGSGAPGSTPMDAVRTEDVDIRRRGEKERIAAEWTRPGVSQPDRTISQREFEQQLLDAQEAAQKAMEEQTIPARYGNVKEFYKRALKKQEGTKPADPPPAPAPDAPDAKDGKNTKEEKKP